MFFLISAPCKKAYLWKNVLYMTDFNSQDARKRYCVLPLVSSSFFVRWLSNKKGVVSYLTRPFLFTRYRR